MLATGYGSTADPASPPAPPQPNSPSAHGEDASRAVRFVRWYIGVIFYLRYPLLLTWGFLLIICAIVGAGLTENLKDEVAPPHDSLAAQANAKLHQFFPTSVNTTGFLAYYDSSAVKSFDLTRSKEFYAFDCFLEYWMNTFRLDDFGPHTDPDWLIAHMPKNTILGAYSSWRVLEAADFWYRGIADYLGPANFSMVAAVVLNTTANDERTTQFYRDFEAAVPLILEKANLTGKVSVALLGLPSFLDEINSASGRDVVVMFGVVVPIALIIFCASLDSLRLGILALASLITTLLGTFAVLDGVARNTDINAITPGIVGALCIALSSDFTYMLVSKFRREVVLESANFFDDPSGVARGVVFVDPKHVMIMVLACAGRVVFITGTSVAFASLGLVFFPLTTFSSIGIGCLVSALMAILVSLVLTPTLLVTFYRFFASGAEACEWPEFSDKCWCCCGDEEEDALSGDVYEPMPLLSAGSGTSLDVGPVPTKQHEQDAKQDAKSGGGGGGGAAAAPSAPSFNASNMSQANPYAGQGGPAAVREHKQQQQPRPGAAAARHVSQGGGGGGSTLSATPSAERLDIDGSNTSRQTSRANSQQARRNKKYGGAHFPNAAKTLSKETVSKEQLQLRDKRIFYRNFVGFLSQPWVAVLCIVVVIGICIYPMTRAFDGKFTNDLDQFVPRDSKLIAPWDSLIRNFRPGDVFPFTIMLKYNKVASNLFPLGGMPFNIGHMIIEELLKIPNTDVRGVEAPFFDPHLWTAADPAKAYLTNSAVSDCLLEADEWIKNSSAPFSPECKYRAAIWQIRVTQYADQAVTSIYVRLKIVPTGEAGRRWLADARALMPRLEAAAAAKYGAYGDISLWISGYGADSYDLVEYSKDNLTMVVAILVSVAWFLVTVFFFSIGASLRLLLSLLFTLLTCFGLATIIFVDGVFGSWPVPAGLAGKEKAEAWLVPFAAIALNIATVLNYDVQATIRVQQFRYMGVSTRSAIVIAAVEGANEVFIAAVMTMVSFVGLLFSQVPVMNQLGFFFICGAFLQGIVFRVFLVVPVMSLMGELNWWPALCLAERCGGQAIPPGVTEVAYSGGGGGGSHGGDSSENTLADIDRLSRGPSRASILAPPAATQTIADNEALMWAARESGLGARRFSSTRLARSSSSSSNLVRGGSGTVKTPMEFVYTPGGSKQNIASAAAAAAASGGDDSASSPAPPPTRGSHMRSSLVPGEQQEQDASSLSRISM